MLNLSRRHSATKCGKTKKRDCTCPIWVTGSLHGEQMRKSLGVRNWESAQKIVRDWEGGKKRELVSVREALSRYMSDCEARMLRAGTMRKYRVTERELVERFGERPIGEVDISDLASYRETWKLAGITAEKKIGRLRAFFKFCVERGWIEKNPAMLLKPPRYVQKPTEPVSDADFDKLLAACDGRERVKAFILTLRYSGLRIQDCVMLTRAKVIEGTIFLYSEKTGVPVRVPLPKFALTEILKWEGEYFFWTGIGSIKTAVGNWQRALARVGKAAGVTFHAHQLRDSFAVSLLLKGVPIADVAALLGNTSRIVEKHYSPWVKVRQDRLEEAVRATFS